MRRETQNILLVLVGGALLKIAVTGTFTRYVRPELRPWLVATGLVMVALALVAIARDVHAAGRQRASQSADPHDPGPGHGHGHGHGHRPSRSPWLLLLPVLAIFLVNPPALGADTVSRTDGRTAVASAGGDSAFAALPADSVVTLPLNELIARTGWDESGSLTGRTVRLTGFVVHKDGTGYLARLAIRCCAADAAPLKVRLAGVDVTTLADEVWIEATGQVRPGSGTKADGYVPTLDATSVRVVDQPADPYEY